MHTDVSSRTKRSVENFNSRRSVFISYSREDGTEFSKELADWLITNNLSVWHDREIVAGDDYDTAIENAIRGCDVFVVVITEGATRSGSFVRREIQYAHDQGKIIVPIRLSEIDHPILLATRQWLTAEESLGPKIVECLTRPTKAKIKTGPTERPGNLLFSKFILLAALVFVSGGLAGMVIRSRNKGQTVPPAKTGNASDETELKQGLADHARILEIRAGGIVRNLAKRQEKETEKTIKLFSELHRENIKALSQGEIARSHELVRQIHELLEPFSPQVEYKVPSTGREWRPPHGELLGDGYPDFGNTVQSVNKSESGDLQPDRRYLADEPPRLDSKKLVIPAGAAQDE